MRARLFGSMCLALASLTQSTSFAQTTAPNSPQGGSQNNETLSEKLDKQKGVLKPKPGVNDPIVKPTPAPNPDKMPVIPPPKAPGAEAK